MKEKLVCYIKKHKKFFVIAKVLRLMQTSSFLMIDGRKRSIQK